MGCVRQEHWSGLPFPSPGDLPNSGIEPVPLALQADSWLPEPPEKRICLHLNNRRCHQTLPDLANAFSPIACPGQFFISRVERCHQFLFLFPRFFVSLNGQKSQPLNDWLSVTGRGEMLSKTGHCFYGNRSWLGWAGMSGFLVGRWPYWTRHHWYPSSRLSCSTKEVISTRSFLSPQVPGAHLSRILMSCLPVIFDLASPVPAHLLFHHSHRENSVVFDFWGSSQCLWNRGGLEGSFLHPPPPRYLSPPLTHTWEPFSCLDGLSEVFTPSSKLPFLLSLSDPSWPHGQSISPCPECSAEHRSAGWPSRGSSLPSVNVKVPVMAGWCALSVPSAWTSCLPALHIFASPSLPQGSVLGILLKVAAPQPSPPGLPHPAFITFW